MTQRRVEDVWPLSPLQEGLLFHALYDERALDVYTVQQIVELDGPLDADLLRRSFAALLDRHASLRAAFRQPAGSQQLVQVIIRGAALPWREIDLSGWAPCAASAEADRLADDERSRRFDLEAPPLLRLLLVRLGETRHRLIVTVHHIVMDGWSMPILMRELWAVYAAGGDTSGLPYVTPYREYLSWLARQDRDRARAAWRETLAGAEEPTLLVPSVRDAAPVMPEEVIVDVGDRLSGELRDLARGAGVTLNTVVQAGWALLVGK
ncbi:condensation domain-containing protein, partial [Actinomadura keratinilytica]